MYTRSFECQGDLQKMLRPQPNNKKQAPVSPASAGRVTSDFPKHTLQHALRVAQAIHDKNSGRPLPPTETAIAIGVSPGSSDFRVLLSSSIKYGLTVGSHNGDRVSITSAGVEIVEPTDHDARARALVAAGLTPPTFRALFEALRGKKLPDPEFFRNTLVRDFGVPREHAAKCVEVFSANADFLQLVKTTPTGRWLASDVAAVVNVDEIPNAESGTSTDAESELPAEAADQPPVPLPKKRSGDAIFIGHGSNRAPLEQLSKILSEYKIPFKVAVDEPNRFRPISEKVAQIMKECSAAILIFTPDEEYRDLDGNAIWKPSENVVFELGAASVLYGKQVVIFKEESVSFPTNFRDIGYIAFRGNDLAAKTHELLRELISFGVIKISVG
jgi:predicted nucleotide-binding protein